MKKFTTVAVLAASMMIFTGCGTAGAAAETETNVVETESTAETENTSEAEGATEAENTDSSNAAGLDDYIIEYSSAVTSVISKNWEVLETDEFYQFETDGTGVKLVGDTEVAFTYACGFDADNQIMLYIIEDESQAREKYIVSSDDTGYRLDLQPVEEGEAKVLSPSELIVLTAEDEEALGLIATWSDDNGNKYVFHEDGTFEIENDDDSDDGTFCAVKNKEDGQLAISIFVAGGTLQYQYEIQEEGNTLELYNKDAETYYYWRK